MPETNPANILYRRTRRLKGDGGEEAEESVGDRCGGAYGEGSLDCAGEGVYADSLRVHCFPAGSVHRALVRVAVYVVRVVPAGIWRNLWIQYWPAGVGFFGYLCR